MGERAERKWRNLNVLERKTVAIRLFQLHVEIILQICSRAVTMDDEQHTQKQLALLSARLKNIKSKLFDEDDTDSLKQILSSSSPESCLAHLKNIEKRGNPHTDPCLLKKLVDCYGHVFSCLPVEKNCRNESYAMMLVKFAELKAIEDPDEAHDCYNIARLNAKGFAFVHIAHAQFELSQGNVKKSTSILQKALELNARPAEHLEMALRNLRSGKQTLVSPEDKENLIVSTYDAQDSVKRSLEFPKSSRSSEGTGDLQLSGSFFSQGMDLKLGSQEEQGTCGWKSSAHLKKSAVGRVPMQPLTNPDFDIAVKKSDLSCSHLKRQTSGTRTNQMFVPSLSKSSKNGGDGDSYSLLNLKSSNISPENSGAELPIVSDSTMTLLNKVDRNVTPGTEGTPLQARTSVSHNKKQKDAPSNLKMSSSLEQSKPRPKDPPSHAFKMPAQINRQAFLEDKRSPAEHAQHQVQNSIPAPSRQSSEMVFETPKYKKSGLNTNSCVTPVLRTDHPAMGQTFTPYNYGSCQHPGQLQQPSTPFSQVSYAQQPPQVPAFSNESVTIKGKAYFILKQIGVGGSSKVFQVLDTKKQLYAVKYVNLKEADSQTIESYKNEIEHLNHLQQYSDQIIKLYDYEITNTYIYMLMECGNLDLNTWLRSRKSVNPLERKFYWRNMLEAVHTIHKHGIIHSDLKPANFVIVNASLKLIDFGIANRIQPDVTSIVKDSQVGTLNYMPPEAIKDTTSFDGRSKISPKSDVWSLGCILYCMTYRKTPFQHITHQIAKLQAIIDPSHEIEFPEISEKDLQDVLKRCLVRNPKERISIAELLAHPYLQLQPQPTPEPVQFNSQELKQIFSSLAALNSPNSISRAANNLAKMCSTGKKFDPSECVKPSTNSS
ncbi:dual specificity protein kinase Ttk isoform X1 [Lepisosteus oculatus]|uniref:dual specificity protein kinase Ttk isoform X1 n=2 Tax=Lepisosteus oculatus TaxID=7918 RepID=UPI0035F507DC